MFEHFKGEEVFVKKVLEFKDQALYKQRIVLTKFLNPYHQSIVLGPILWISPSIAKITPLRKSTTRLDCSFCKRCKLITAAFFCFIFFVL